LSFIRQPGRTISFVSVHPKRMFTVVFQYNFLRITASFSAENRGQGYAAVLVLLVLVQAHYCAFQ